MSNYSFTEKNSYQKAFYIILFLFGALFLTIYFCNHYFFRTFAFDYGAYNFAFYDFAHFRSSLCPVYHVDAKFIQDHVSLTLIFFAPMYWLFSWITGTYTLLFIQTGIILFGAWGVFKLVELKTTNNLLPFLAGLYYFLILGRWTAFTSDCNFAIMASSIIPVFMYYFEKRKWLLFALSFLFILTTREDMALWTLFIGLFYLVIYRKDKDLRKASVLVIISSAAFFIITFTIIIPALESPGMKYVLFNYSALGDNPWEALTFMVKHPLKALQLLFINHSGNPDYDQVKMEFYMVYLLSGGLLVLLRPVYILLFIPLIAKKMLNDDPIRWSVELYYSIEFVSILPIAVFLIITSFKNRKLQIYSGILVCLVTFLVSAHKLTGKRELNWWPREKYAFYSPKMYSAGFNAANVHNALDIIPRNARVSASGQIVPHLAFREKIYYFPRVNDAEYLVVFTQKDTYPLSQEEFDMELKKYWGSKEWEVLTDDNPLLILKKID